MLPFHTTQVQSVCCSHWDILRKVVDGELSVKVLLQLFFYFLVLIFQPIAFQPYNANSYKRSRNKCCNCLSGIYKLSFLNCSAFHPTIGRSRYYCVGKIQASHIYCLAAFDLPRLPKSVQPFADSLKRLHELSPYYFSSIIREKSGKSALQWIGNITMIFSRQYLKCSDMSIKEIADCLNFPDQSSFARYFKHHEGCSPMEFRNRRLQD